jgi:hypothetical protein
VGSAEGADEEEEQTMDDKADEITMRTAGQSALHRHLLDALARDGVDDMERPHLVVIRFPDGSLLVEGPHPTGMGALVAADARERELVEEYGPGQTRPEVSVSLAVPPGVV